MYCAFLLCTVFRGEICTKEGSKVAIAPICMLVAEGVCTSLWDPNGPQRHGCAP